MKQINLRVPEELLAQIDSERGLVPRNAWIVQRLQGGSAEPPQPPPARPAESKRSQRASTPYPRTEAEFDKAMPMYRDKPPKPRREPSTEVPLPKIAKRHWT